MKSKGFTGRTHTLETRAKMSNAQKGKVLSSATREKIRRARLKTSMTVDEFWEQVKKGDGCWEWQGLIFHASGYGRVHWEGRGQNAHRIAYELTYGKLPSSKVCACHHCDNRPCCRPDHLFPGTAKDNQLDSSRKGRNTKGRKQDPEFVERRIARHRGMKRSPETCAKISAKAKERGATKEYREKRRQITLAWWKKRKRGEYLA